MGAFSIHHRTIQFYEAVLDMPVKKPASKKPAKKPATRKIAKNKKKPTATQKKGIRPTQTRKKPAAVFEIMDNGGTPYAVEVKPASLRVIQARHVIYQTPYRRLFIGEKTGRLQNDSTYQRGSSMLAEVKPNEYVHIGSEIYSFTTTEPIHTYESLVGPSRVPYPYAIGDTTTYFMLDHEKVPNELLDHTKDAYGQFYGYTIDKKKIDAIQKKKSAFRIKIIHKQ